MIPPQPCSACRGRQHWEAVCPRCAFPVFTPLGGMRMLARSLLEHYEVDSTQHAKVVAELADVIGEELLSIGRDILVERGLLAPVDTTQGGGG